MGESKTADTANMKNNKRLLWIGRICLLVSTASAIGFSLMPDFFLRRGHGLGPALAFGLPMLIIAGIAWIWYRTGGTAVVVWASTMLVVPGLIYPFIGRNAVNTTAYFPIYVLFLLGGILHLFIHQPYKPALSHRWLKGAAIAVTFLPLIAFIIFAVIMITRAFPGIFHVWMSVSTFGIIWCFFALVFAFIAVRDAKAGGILVIMAGGLFFSAVFLARHYPDIYLPVSSIYTVGGILHLIRAFPDRTQAQGKK